jgi:hypothetical protein
VSPFPFGILNVVYKVSLISLIDFTVGCCITDTICACLSFAVSDLQTFLGSKIIEEEVKKEEENLMALSEDGCVQQLDLRYNINIKIKDILSTRTTFGYVYIETSNLLYTSIFR